MAFVTTRILILNNLNVNNLHKFTKKKKKKFNK